jgi:hypothetical protein
MFFEKSAQLLNDYFVEGCASFSGFDGEPLMHGWWNANSQLAGVRAIRQRHGWLFTSIQISDGISHELNDAVESVVPFGTEPTQARKFRAESDELLVFLRPDHTIRVPIYDVHFHPSSVGKLSRSMAASSCLT